MSMSPIPGSSRISASSDAFSIAPARGAADMDVVRALFAGYRGTFASDMCFPGFAEELAGLPGKYAPPEGEILLARNAIGAPIGCVALRGIEPGIAEMKRMYVLESGRGLGVGRAMAVAIVDIARNSGYRRLNLDTMPHLTPAIALYRSLGFAAIERYNDNPNPGVLFFAKDLAPWTIAPARGAADIEDFRALVKDYVDSIRAIALLHLVDQEIAGLPEPYVPPKGEILLARDGQGAAIGCVALRPLPEAGAVELKRLYVAPACRRRGLARALVSDVMGAARRMGHAEIKLDFIPSMAEGHALYRALGFAEIERYNQNPNPKLIFMSKRL
jgi:ribosomal protein S18 acetylase RimI-like enzyme